MHLCFCLHILNWDEYMMYDLLNDNFFIHFLVSVLKHDTLPYITSILEVDGIQNWPQDSAKTFGGVCRTSVDSQNPQKMAQKSLQSLFPCIQVIYSTLGNQTLGISTLGCKEISLNNHLVWVNYSDQSAEVIPRQIEWWFNGWESTRQMPSIRVWDFWPCWEHILFSRHF